jgi:hypothetical protein
VEGEFVAQLADDDLWFPDHLEQLALLLETFDFGTLLPLFVDPNGTVTTHLLDLADPIVQGWMMDSRQFNFFGPTAAGYRLDSYRSLPEGWTPAPSTLQSDLHQWRKFIAAKSLRLGTRFVPTSVAFPSPQRKHLSLTARAEEIRRWSADVTDPAFRARIVESALVRAAREYARATAGWEASNTLANTRQTERLRLLDELWAAKNLSYAERILRRVYRKVRAQFVRV